MIFDLPTMDRAGFGEALDVCVIGSGPAGLTLARRLAGRGARVALMEAGGFDFDEQSQDLYTGELLGQDYYPLDICRLRFFGGTSNHWGGQCRALDAGDFEPVAYHRFSGWPIGKADLDPYQPDADEVLELPSAAEAPNFPLEQKSARFDNIQFRFSPPVRFGPKYRAEVEASDRITFVTSANLVDLRLSEDQSRVVGAVFKSYAPGDPGLSVSARAYALCAGGIDNARLLLNFSSQAPEGVGNRHDLVGRFFNEHPHFTIGRALLSAPVPERLFYSPTPEFKRARQILTFGLRLEPSARSMPPLSTAVSRSVACDRPYLERLHEELRGRPPDCEGPALPEYLGLRGNVRVRIAQEQELNPDSRVTLGPTLDRFGLRQAQLDWRVGALDIHTMRTAITAFGEHLAEQDLGRVRIADWLLAEPAQLPAFGEDEVGGPHHMCTTRMAADPRQGVVDRNCRVHALDNLYVGGSSVFASGGHANPTYTIVQLALRLGDHISSQLGA